MIIITIFIVLNYQPIATLWHLKSHHSSSSYNVNFLEMCRCISSDCFVIKLTVHLIDSHSLELKRICYGAFPNDIPSPITVLTFWLPYLFLHSLPSLWRSLLNYFKAWKSLCPQSTFNAWWVGPSRGSPERCN